MPTFYADEDFPGPLIAVLRVRGYDILTVPQDGRAGADDPTVLSRAAELGRVVLTKNRTDFHRLHAAVPNHSGIVTITDDQDRAALADRIHAAVSAHPDLSGVLIRIVKPNTPPPWCRDGSAEARRLRPARRPQARGRQRPSVRPREMAAFAGGAMCERGPSGRVRHAGTRINLLAAGRTSGGAWGLVARFARMAFNRACPPCRTAVF